MSHPKTARWRAWSPFVHWTAKLIGRAVRWRRNRRHKLAQPRPPLSDHLARDIGLSPTERALQELRLPSRHTHHPYG